MSVVQVEDGPGGVRTIWLNRPEKLNALDTALTTALRDAFAAADRDKTVRAVVLAGRGRGFCAGADLTEFANLTPAHREAVTERAVLTAELQALPQRLSVPVVAAFAGPARGGGAGLALACDVVVAAHDASLGYPEVRHSIVPALVMTGLQRHFGRKLGFELVSTGRTLHAEELLRLGVVNELVDRGMLVERAQEIAAVWASSSPTTMSAIKDLYYRVSDLPFDMAIRAGQDVNTIMRSFAQSSTT